MFDAEASCVSIRKRYDEARLLTELEQYEAALIIVLVAVAGCSVIEGMKKGWTKDYADRGQPNFKSDRHFFIEYLKDPKRANVVGSDIIEGMAETLYGELRCTLIHEAVIFDDDHGYSEALGNFSYQAGSFRFGRGLLYSLLRAIRLDENIADQFADIRHPLERKPTTFDMSSIDQLVADFNATVSAELGDFSVGRMLTALRQETLLALIEHVGIEAFLPDRWPEKRDILKDHEQELLYFSGNKLSGGTIGGLMKTHPQVVNESRTITEDGWGLLCRIAQHANFLTI